MQILPAPVSWRRALAARMGFLFSMTSPEPAAATPSPAEVSGRRFSPAAGGGPVSSVALLLSPPEFSCKRTSLAAGGGAVSSVEFSCRRVSLLWLPSSAAAGGGAVSAACLFLRITMREALGFPWTSHSAEPPSSSPSSEIFYVKMSILHNTPKHAA